MATIADSLRQSSVNIQNISKSLASTKGSVANVNESVSNISKIIATNTKIKSDLFARSDLLNTRRREASLRQEKEDALEASEVSTSPIRGLSFASKSDKGPLGRLLGFLGFITAGWIVENLPTWIFMGKEFVSRIQTFGRSMYDMVGNMQLIIRSFGDVLKNSFSAIIRLDFDEFSEGSVTKSFGELNSAVQGLGNDITETFRLFTTPLTEALETGEQAPGLGEDRPETMFPEGAAPSRVTGIHKQALDIISGPESGGSYNAMNQGTIGDKIVGSTGNSKTKIGKELTSMTIGEIMQRQAYLMNKSNPQVSDYGIYAAGRYQIIPATMRAAVQRSGLKPTDMFSPENQDKLGLAVLKSQGIGAWTVGGSRYTAAETAIIKQAQRTPVTYAPTSSTKSSTSAVVQPAQTMLTSGYGWRWGRMHKGVDIVPKQGKVEGTPVILRKGGVIEYAYIDGRNMGMVLVTHDDGTQSHYLHVNNFKVKKGQRVQAGQTIAHLAAMGAPGIGNATGPHLHFEYYQSTSSSYSDPTSVYKNYVALGGKVLNTPDQPLDPTQPSRQSTAQISPQSRQQPASAITPNRKGSSIIFIDDTQSQMSQASYSSPQQSPTPTISESKLLNNFIKNKLLLDLAYL